MKTQIFVVKLKHTNKSYRTFSFAPRLSMLIWSNRLTISSRSLVWYSSLLTCASNYSNSTISQTIKSNTNRFSRVQENKLTTLVICPSKAWSNLETSFGILASPKSSCGNITWKIKEVTQHMISSVKALLNRRTRRLLTFRDKSL